MEISALSIDPEKWKHAETVNFVIHYRRATEARRAVREIEYNLWYVANFLGATKDRYTTKSHVFIFADEKEWKEFLAKDPSIPSWAGSFALDGSLFLHIGGAGEGFDSHTLAHEATHVVISRLYPTARWPLWLNEGFAEYMGSASIAARRGQTLQSLQNRLSRADIPLATLVSLTGYPSDQASVASFYESSERLIRFLLTRFPQERFVDFVDALIAGATLEDALLKTYPQQVTSLAKFEKDYEKFKR